MASTGIKLSDMKYIKMMLSVVGIFTVCWSPYMAIFTVKLFTDLNIYPEVIAMSSVPVTVNYGMNFFIYVVKDTKIMNAIRDILQKKRNGVQNM